MANNVLLEEFGGFDLHLGGKDLQFPHHANEVAQLEAYYNKSDLIQMFMHSGHLKIDNQVMSKSLMNFKTIEEGLKNYTANQLRLLFLQVEYSADIDYSINQLVLTTNLDDKITQFIKNVNAIPLEKNSPNMDQKDIQMLKLMAQTDVKVK